MFEYIQLSLGKMINKNTSHVIEFTLQLRFYEAFALEKMTENRDSFVSVSVSNDHKNFTSTGD